MPRFTYNWDLFISYAHADDVSLNDQLPWIEALADEIKANHAEFSPRPLKVFIDREVISSMDEWDFKIREALKTSRVMLAVMSPSYFASKYCQKEWEVYLERELARAMADRAIAPVYVIDVPGIDSEGEAGFERWRSNLQSRQHIDIRPWWEDGPEALRLGDVRARMAALEQSIAGVIQASDRIADSPTNIDGHNQYFCGREQELKEVRGALAMDMSNRVCVLQGLGGIGKTAIAVEYAHAFGLNYPGGRFLLRASGHNDLDSVLHQLAGPLGVGATGSSGDGRDVQLERIMEILAEGPKRLVFIDNVESPNLFTRQQMGMLAGLGDQLDVLLTTRLSPENFMDCTVIPIENFSERDGAALLEKYREVHDEGGRESQHAISRCLGGYPLLIEAAAVFLWQNPDISLAGFLERLRSEGPLAVDAITQTENIRLLNYDESSVTQVLGQTLGALSSEEWAALEIAAVLPAEFQLWRWIRLLLGEQHPQFTAKVDLGYPDPWLQLCRRLIGLRLLQGNAMSSHGRMHQVVQAVVRARMGQDALAKCRRRVFDFVGQRATVLAIEWFRQDNRAEVDAMIPTCLEALATGNAEHAAGIATTMNQAWVWLDREREVLDLYEQLLSEFAGLGDDILEADLKAALAGHIGTWDLDRSARLATEAYGLVADRSDAPDLILARIWQIYAIHGVIPSITWKQKSSRLEKSREYAQRAGETGILLEIAVLNILGMSYAQDQAQRALTLFNRAFELATA